MGLCEFHWLGVNKTSQSAFEGFKSQCFIAACIAESRGHVNDLCQPFRFLCRVLLFRIPQLVDPQPVPARVHDTEPAYGAILFSRPQDAGNAGNGQLPITFSQSGSKILIQSVRVRYDDDDTAVRVGWIESFHAKKMNVDVLQSHDRVRVGTDLPVGFPEPESFVERYGFIEFAAR